MRNKGSQDFALSQRYLSPHIPFMSQWFRKPMTKRVAFYLPSNVKGKTMSAGRRADLIQATMNFLVTELGGGTQTEATGSFAGEGGKLIQEDVTICYGWMSKATFKKNEREINQIANALAIEFEQESLAMELDGKFYLVAPKQKYRDYYDANIKGARTKGTEWGYWKWLPKYSGRAR